MNTTLHPATPEEIMAFLDGELSAADSQGIARHLEGCEECAAIADQFRATARALAGWSVPATAVHLDQAAIQRATKSRTAPTGLLSWKPWAFGGGVLVTAVVLFLIVSPFAPPPSPFIKQTAPATLPEQAEASLDVQKSQQFPSYSKASKAAPQIAGIAGMMLREDGPPSPSMAMPARSMAPAPVHSGGGAQGFPLSMSAPMIARTVSLALRVHDIPIARAALDRIVAQHQGYAAELTLAAGNAGFPTLEASLRIPAPELAAAVAELKTLGLVESEAQTGEELSQQHQDLLARLKNCRATEERFRAILQQHAGSVSSILEVEQAIATVREEIERMEAEQEALEHRVTFATVNLRLVSQASVRPSAPSFSSRLHAAFSLGYRNAIENLFGIALFLAENGLTLLIWLVLLGGPAVLLWRRSRRIRSRL